MKSQQLSKKSKKSIWIKQPINCEVVVTTKQIKSMILKYKDGTFHLSKPTHVSDKQAIEWLESLTKHQFDALKETHKIKCSNNFVYIFGRKFKLKIYDMNIPKALIKEGEVLVYHKNYLEKYLKELLKYYITKRVKELHLVDFDVKIEVQKMTSKYGCCFYNQQRMKFASRLIHEPKEVIDSIIIHELAHFYYHNHQKEFYQYVYKHDPHYKEHEMFLKSGGAGDDPISK